MKQTAVEWLVKEIVDNNHHLGFDIWEAFYKAKLMEKQQIIDAFDSGYYDYDIEGEQYYNETFKPE